MDRISRQTQDYLQIRNQLTSYGISLISANEPTGNFPTDITTIDIWNMSTQPITQ